MIKKPKGSDTWLRKYGALKFKQAKKRRQKWTLRNDRGHMTETENVVYFYRHFKKSGQGAKCF